MIRNQGARVELIRCTDELARVPPGTRGTIRFVDALETVHVDWDTGHRLGLIAEAGDVWKPVHEWLEADPEQKPERRADDRD